MYRAYDRINRYVAGLLEFDFRNVLLTAIKYFRINTIPFMVAIGKGVKMIKKVYKDNDELNTYETADVLEKERSTLATWRSTGQHNLKYLKRHGEIFYKYSDLIKFKEDQTKHF